MKTETRIEISRDDANYKKLKQWFAVQCSPVCKPPIWWQARLESQQGHPVEKAMIDRVGVDDNIDVRSLDAQLSCCSENYLIIKRRCSLILFCCP